MEPLLLLGSSTPCQNICWEKGPIIFCPVTLINQVCSLTLLKLNLTVTLFSRLGGPEREVWRKNGGDPFSKSDLNSFLSWVYYWSTCEKKSFARWFLFDFNCFVWIIFPSVCCCTTHSGQKRLKCAPHVKEGSFLLETSPMCAAHFSLLWLKQAVQQPTHKKDPDKKTNKKKPPPGKFFSSSAFTDGKKLTQKNDPDKTFFFHN